MSGAYEGWAIVELMGHRKRAGRICEVEQFGATLLRIDIPAGEDTVKPSASRLRMVMGGLSDPKLMVADAVRQTYGADGSSKFGRDIYYVLRAFDAIAQADGA